MEEYVYIDGKQYRRGYTTGSCATAAAKAATYMLITKQPIDNINIDTPKGILLNIKIHNVKITDDYVECSVQKDGGDDIDATHKMHIYARAEINNESLSNIEVCGGVGIGVITKKGLSVEVGKAAINPVPMRMILNEVDKVKNTEKIKITIYAPRGEEVAKKTFNPRLGIMGGISIIGTTGIVEPMSDEGWKKSLSLELKMKKELGVDKIILVPGNHGEKFVQENLGLDMKHVVRTSNFIGYMLKEAQRFGYKKIFLVGHIGKYIKLSAGIFNTHSKIADARNEILISNLAMMKAPYELLTKINECLTTDEAVEIINEYGYGEIYDLICDKCKLRVEQYLQDEDIEVETMIFSMDKTLLGKSKNADSLVEVFR